MLLEQHGLIKEDDRELQEELLDVELSEGELHE